MFILYGLGNCDTCRKARAWLEAHHQAHRFHDFRKDGLDAELLGRFAAELGWDKLLNRRGTTWRGLSADEQADLGETKALQLMEQYPALIKRPILDSGTRLILGFPSAGYPELP